MSDGVPGDSFFLRGVQGVWGDNCVGFGKFMEIESII